MFVVTRDPRPVGSEVAFDLKLADGFRLFHGHGEVAWVRLHDGGREQPQGMALRFIALDEKGRELVLKVLEEQVKAGGQPFEVDPPPADALLDYGGGPSNQAQALPVQTDLGEEPTLVGRKRSLDETGFDAPWGQKLPEVPTDLLDDGPSVPSVSEVQFAPVLPARPAGQRPATAEPSAAAGVAAPGTQSGLFAAAFPGRHSGTESPADLGFVLDENPPLAPSPAERAAPAAAGWALGGGQSFANDTLAPDEDPLVDFDGVPADPAADPYAGSFPDYDAPAFDLPAYDASPDYASPAADSSPAFDSEEPTMIGSSRPGAGDWGAAAGRMPEAGVFEVLPPASAGGAAAERPAFEPWSPEAAPAWDAAPAWQQPPAPAYDPVAPASPVAPAASSAAGGPGAKPSLFDNWSPTAAPADPFAAPADPFAAPAAGAHAAPADPFAPAGLSYGSPAANSYGAPASAYSASADPFAAAPGPAPAPLEPYQPFDLGSAASGGATLGRPSGLEDAAEGFGLGAPAVSPGYGAQPPVYPAGYFAAGGPASGSPASGDPASGGPAGAGAQDPYYAEEADSGEGWTSEHEPPSKGERFKAALMSRKAIWGLVATAALVTGAYFLAGDLLDGGDAVPVASGPPPAVRRPAAREEAAPSPAAPSSPFPADADDPNEPERVIARDGQRAGLPPADGSGDPPADGVGEDSRVALPPAAEPIPAAPVPAVPAPAAPAFEPGSQAAPRGAPAGTMVQVEVQKGAGQTVVELIFDGEMPSSSYRHDRLEYKRDRELITFTGVGAYRGANRSVGSPELSAINFGIHPDGLHAVFVRPPGARISNITSEGNRVRVVLDR